jgi:NADPH-dependent glutamate synthase beta subunit-like oxidoreductase/CO/xanthine dehydrogenase FAD-binding subunit
MNLRHHRTSDLVWTTSMLATAGGGGRPVAGGTDLLGILKDRVHSELPHVLLDLKLLSGLDGVEERDDEIAIGALTRLGDLEYHPVIGAAYSVLAQAAHAVASPQIRNMGTVGGNICQEPRCWYYRAPDDAFHCTRKGGRYCNALTGDNRFHSVFGSMKVDTRPCTATCPGGVEIPEYMELVRAGDLDGAARLLLRRNPLPAISGRVCPHTCESECNRGCYDEPVSVRTVERALGDRVLEHPELLGTPSPETGASVAVVGSGPAGLSAAYYLRSRGHAVTVYERAPEPGGMLRYGIPAFRLPKDILDRQIARLEELGIAFVCSTAVGDGVDYETLRGCHDATFVATGAWAVPHIGLDGEEALRQGIHFLTDVARGDLRELKPRVLVIGGGNVAVDVAVTARRLGAQRVTIACLEACGEMPALPEEVDEALAEGIELIPSCGPARLLRDGDGITGLELRRCLSVFDEACRFAPTYDDADLRVVEADEVILAVGQRVETQALAAAGMPIDGGRLAVDQETQATSLDGVFAGGDVATGPATVIAAMAAGRRAALAIGQYLGRATGGGAMPGSGAARGFDVGRADPVDEGSGLGRMQTFDAAMLTPTGRCHVAALPANDRTLLDEDVPMVAIQDAIREAGRCFNCGCVAVTPSDLAPALVALDAVVVTTDRELPAAEFFAARSAGSTVLTSGELVREVRLPRRTDGWRSAYVKFRLRQSIDFPIASVALALEVVDGKVADARIVLGAAAPVPQRALAAEQAVVGRSVAELLEGAAACEVADRALEGCLPLTESGYKVRILRTLVKRALLGVAADSTQMGDEERAADA